MKKIILLTILFLLGTGTASATLYDYFGGDLPPLEERGCDIENYTGTAEQNEECEKQLNQAVLGAQPALTAFQGGTGTSSPSGILYGDETIRLKSVEIGNNLTFSGGTLSASGGDPDWVKELNFGVLTLTPSTTIPVWIKDAIYGSSTLQVVGNTRLGSALYVSGAHYASGTLHFDPSLNSTGNPFITVNDSSASADIYWLTPANELAFARDNSLVFSIDDDQLKIRQSGTRAEPSFSFNNGVSDETSGLFRAGANILGFSANAREFLRFDGPNLVTTFNSEGDDQNFVIEGDTDTALVWVDGGTQRVGISTSSPFALLSVDGQLNADYITLDGSATNTAENGWDISGGCFAINGTCVTDLVNTLAFPWTPDTTYNENANSTTTPIWLKDSLYASSTSFFSDEVQIFDERSGANGEYDLVVGGTYGAINLGNVGIYSSAFSNANLNLDKAVLFRQEGNIGAGNDPGIEFAWMEQGNSLRLAIPESGAGNAMNVIRSLILAGPYANTIGNNIVKCVNFQGATTWNFWAIDCDTSTTGPDLGILDDAQILGKLYVGETITSSSTITIEDIGKDMILTSNGSGLIVASSSPTASHYYATSTTATSTFAGDLVFGNGFFWDTSIDSLSIGQEEYGMTIGGTSYPSVLSVHAHGDSTQAEIEVHRHSDTAGLGSVLYGARSRGTEGAETAVQNGDILFTLGSFGQDGTDYEFGSRVDFVVDGTVGANNVPTSIRFRTEGTGGSLVDGLYIDADGNVGVGTTSPGTLLSLNNLANFHTATSSFYSSGGIDLSGGCFAINGVCIQDTDTFASIQVDGVAQSTNAPTLDFDGTEFTLTESPTDDFDIVVADVENLSTSLTTGSVIFSNGSNLTQDNSEFFWDDTNNRLGIGTTTPSSPLAVDLTITDIAGTNIAFQVDQWENITSNLTSTPRGNQSNVYNNISTGITNSGFIIGHQSNAILHGDGTLDSAIGISGTVDIESGNGTINDAKALQAQVFITSTGGGTYSTTTGLRVNNPTLVGGSITNNYGIYLDNLTAGTNNYSLISESTTANMGLGTTTPWSLLSVAGQTVAQNFYADTTTATSTFLGDVYIGNNGELYFEGSTEDANDTILRAIDPTQDNNIYLPDGGGVVALAEFQLDCVAATSVTGAAPTTDNDQAGWLFDPDSDEAIACSYRVPTWANGTETYQVKFSGWAVTTQFSCGSTPEEARFNVASKNPADGEDVAGAYSAAESDQALEVPCVAGFHDTYQMDTLTFTLNNETMVAGDMGFILITRNANDASDDFDLDAFVPDVVDFIISK